MKPPPMIPPLISAEFRDLPPVLSGLGEVARRYEAAIIDLWGCVHNGVEPFPHAIETLRRLREAGLGVLVLSNAPRRAAAVAAGMARLGLGGDLYDHVLSSGEATWLALAERHDAWHAGLGVRALHIGPERDLSLFEGNGLARVTEASTADFVLVTGPNDDSMSVADHEDLLQATRGRGLKMVCANPDHEVIRGHQRLVCAGALAARYETLGGEVRYHGKPYPSIYQQALALMGGPPPLRVLAVGDGLHTDIAGALGAGIDCAFIAGGIHGAELGIAMGEPPSAEARRAILASHGLRPTYFLPQLKW